MGPDRPSLFLWARQRGHYEVAGVDSTKSELLTSTTAGSGQSRRSRRSRRVSAGKCRSSAEIDQHRVSFSLALQLGSELQQ